MTEARISIDTILAAGYKEYPVPATDSCDRFFQRSVSNEKGKLYFIEFRQWSHQEHISFDCKIVCETDSGGHLWATFREEYIEACEDRALALWVACGSVPYEREETNG